MSGGRSSAYGFLYQYLATADYFLRYLSADIDPADVALLVEPTALTGSDQDIVDFAIENNGVVVERVQVKGSSDPSGNKLHPGDTGDVMRRLGAALVGVSQLLTNRPLSSGLAEQCTLVESEGSSFDRFAYHPGDLSAAVAGQFILVDNRSVDDLAASASRTHPLDTR